MACYHPLNGYKSKARNPSGKRSIVFSKSDAFTDLTIQIPCGQCIGCRLDKSLGWALRCHHEASLYSENAFITLTYRDEDLPPGGTLVKKHFQDFMKRLRAKNPGKTIRYFHCGEYGENFHRAHYHAILFNHDFADKIHTSTHNGNKYYTSAELGELWPHGFNIVGDVTFESAAYVARYITKKVTGKGAEAHYSRYTADGYLEQFLQPEYITMSRNPGIAKGWFEKYKKDLFPDDFVVLEGKKKKMPKFYSSNFEHLHPKEFQKTKAERKAAAKKHESNNTWDRLLVREEIQLAKADKLKRSYEK